MPRMPSQPFPEKILCILCIHVNQSFCSGVRYPTPGITGCHFLSLVDVSQPVFLHPNRGAFPLNGSRTPSFFVCLRGPSCNFVDSSFVVVVSGKWRPRPRRRCGSSKWETNGVSTKNLPSLMFSSVSTGFSYRGTKFVSDKWRLESGMRPAFRPRRETVWMRRGGIAPKALRPEYGSSSGPLRPRPGPAPLRSTGR